VQAKEEMNDKGRKEEKRREETEGENNVGQSSQNMNEMKCHIKLMHDAAEFVVLDPAWQGGLKKSYNS